MKKSGNLNNLATVAIKTELTQDSPIVIEGNIKDIVLAKIEDIHIKQMANLLIDGNEQKLKEYIGSNHLSINQLFKNLTCISYIVEHNYDFSREIVDKALLIYVRNNGITRYIAQGYAIMKIMY